MQVLLAVLALAFVDSSLAASEEIVCANCTYSSGLGYVENPSNCNQFFQCVKRGGYVDATLLCCPNGTLWQQDHLGCVRGHCTDPRDDCPAVPTTTDFPCPFERYPSNSSFFVDSKTSEVMQCADNTIYSADDCACVTGGRKTCQDDPLMYFPFAKHFNDIQCHKVKGTEHGDAALLKEEGCIRLDGHEDYVTFGFLQNYFAWNKLKHFTVSLWFNQDQAGWDNVNNSPVEGLFGNGDCDQDASIWLTMGDTYQQGGIRTDETSAVFNTSGDDVSARFYQEPLIWCQVAIRFADNKTTLFLNGKPTGMRDISGYIANTFAKSTIGLTYFKCDPFFWTGLIDDCMIFDRYLSDAEMLDNVFGRGRTPAGSEAEYKSDFYP